MSWEACPAGFPLWIFIWTWPTDVPLRSTKRSILEWVPQPPLPWTLYPEGRLQRLLPASQGMYAFTVWMSYIWVFLLSFQVYNVCVFLCSLSVNHRLTGRCIMKTLRKTWGSSALRAAPGLENAARETCTAVSKIFESHVLTFPPPVLPLLAHMLPSHVRLGRDLKTCVWWEQLLVFWVWYFFNTTMSNDVLITYLCPFSLIL